MRIKYKKTGNFAFHPVYGPVHLCINGQVDEIVNSYAKQLIMAGWAESLEPELMELPPWKRDSWDEKSPGAKTILQQYCSDKYGTVIDKRKSVKTIIGTIIEIAKTHNG